MYFRVFSGLMVLLSAWSAELQLNDPDPARWVAMYLSCAVVALLAVLDRPAPRIALLVMGIALAWALAIAPELIGTWQPSDLTATMSERRPEIEYGRELGGLLIVATYCLAASLVWRRRASTSSSVTMPPIGELR